jgi:hypothetical protein
MENAHREKRFLTLLDQRLPPSPALLLAEMGSNCEKHSIRTVWTFVKSEKSEKSGL